MSYFPKYPSRGSILKLLGETHYHLHTYHKLWTEICEIRQIFKWDLIKFCVIFTKIILMLPQSSQKPLFICKKLGIKTRKCDSCLFLHKMCCKMIWKFCEIWSSYGNWLPDRPNSVGFYLTVWDMACMHWDQNSQCLPFFKLYKGATSWGNLFMPYANNKGADQPAHPRSLISIFVFTA